MLLTCAVSCREIAATGPTLSSLTAVLNMETWEQAMMLVATASPSADKLGSSQAGLKGAHGYTTYRMVVGADLGGGGGVLGSYGYKTKPNS